MIAYPASLKATGGAHTGIAPVNLLDVLDVNGNLYYWADRPVNAPVVITGSTSGSGSGLTPPVEIPTGQFVAWAYPQVETTSLGLEAVPGAGVLALSEGGPFTSPVTADVYGFGMPQLPPGAVVQKAIAVVYMDFQCSPVSNALVSPFLVPNGPFDGNFQCDLGWGGDGTVTDCHCSFEVVYSLVPPGPGTFNNPVQIALTYSGLAIAIYYSIPATVGGEPAPSGSAASGGLPYLPWILQVPSFSFYRSLQTSSGSFVVQNVSGDSLSRDMEKILRGSALEGAFFVYRLWQPDAEAAWIEVHGTLTLDDDGVDTITFKTVNLLNPAQDDTPLEIFCETCQLNWAGPRCGSTQSTECSYSYQTCQVVERIMVVTNDYEKNYGEAAANTALNVINRRRKI